MIAILYPFKMDKLSEAYSAIYESPLHPNLQKNEDNVKKKIQDQAAKNQQRDADRAKSASAFQAHKKSEMASGKRPDQALDSWQQKKLKKEGKYRSEWNTLKLLEKENHRETFDTWLTGIVEEGYDTDRWSDEELVEAFISENDLWGSRDMVLEALLEGYKPLPKEKMSRQADKAYAKEVVAAHHGKSKEANKQMQRRIAIQDPSGRRQAILNKEEVVTEEDKKGSGSGKKDACYKKVKASASVWPSAYASGRLVQCRKKGAANYGNSKSESYSWRDDFDYVEEGAAWTKKSGKNKEGGLNEKGRKSYERENPGSDLKAPQPEGGSRKKSFCARMGGMKKKLTSSKTANDPDSRINKSLRKWNCSYEPEGDVINELNRYEKETGKSSGSMNLPKGKPTSKGGTSSLVMRAVRSTMRKETGKPEGQQKKVKGSKSDAGTGKYLDKQKSKQEYASKAKKAGFKSTQDYANTMARYGGEDNYRKGKGLGT